MNARMEPPASRMGACVRTTATRSPRFVIRSASIISTPSVAAAAGVTNASFEVAGAEDFRGRGYDLVCYFDCLHDLGDPVAAATHAAEAVAPDGTVLLV